jgi:hypothetical protein
MRVLIEVSYDKQFEDVVRQKNIVGFNSFITLTEVNEESADPFEMIADVCYASSSRLQLRDADQWYQHWKEEPVCEPAGRRTLCELPGTPAWRCESIAQTKLPGHKFQSHPGVPPARLIDLSGLLFVLRWSPKTLKTRLSFLFLVSSIQVIGKASSIVIPS